MAGKYSVGTSGWHYDHWRERFYPGKLPKARWLEFYGRYFSTVEINSSFYHLPTEKSVNTWRDSSAPDFVFSVKVSRYVTHIKRLNDSAEATDLFLARARLLKAKLGPLLYQLPPQMKRDDYRLEEFLKILPGDVRHVFEFRDRSWFDDDIFELLHRYKIGFCIYDMPEFSTPVVATTDFAYLRFHGSGKLYGGDYPREKLEYWAQQVLSLEAETVYIYFNNDIQGFAIKNARLLKEILNVSASPQSV